MALFCREAQHQNPAANKGKREEEEHWLFRLLERPLLSYILLLLPPAAKPLPPERGRQSGPYFRPIYFIAHPTKHILYSCPSAFSWRKKNRKNRPSPCITRAIPLFTDYLDSPLPPLSLLALLPSFSFVSFLCISLHLPYNQKVSIHTLSFRLWFSFTDSIGNLKVLNCIIICIK